MPSPIGHALGGVAAGWLVAGRPCADDGQGTAASSGPWRREALLFALIGTVPDLDLLAGVHSMYTHSIGAVAIAVLAALVWTRGRRPLFALACGAALASHILLDWLGSDTTPPIGIMALWPFTPGFYQSSWSVFEAISRRWWLPEFYWWNARAALREIAILLPIAAVAGTTRRRRRAAEERTGTRVA